METYAALDVLTKRTVHIVVTRTRTRLGSTAFSVAGPAACNSLPASIRSLKSIERQPLDSVVQTCILICTVGLVRMFYLLSNFYLMFLLLFFIVSRPWPKFFVCKGRHTSSVVLVLYHFMYVLCGYTRHLIPYKTQQTRTSPKPPCWLVGPIRH